MQTILYYIQHISIWCYTPTYVYVIWCKVKYKYFELYSFWTNMFVSIYPQIATLIHIYAYALWIFPQAIKMHHLIFKCNQIRIHCKCYTWFPIVCGARMPPGPSNLTHYSVQSSMNRLSETKLCAARFRRSFANYLSLCFPYE